MHPMFKELFIQTDADDLLAEEDRRRRVSRARRARSAMIIRPPPVTGGTSRDRNRRSACCAARWPRTSCWWPRRPLGAPRSLSRLGGAAFQVRGKSPTTWPMTKDLP
jgi:hypothetical protein